MTDIIIPKKLSLIKSKEMHGHVILDIHNTRSGFTERIEHHNTVTTSADEFMWLNYLAILHSGSGYRPSSIYGDIYGGVFLFENTISAASRLPLGNNHLVGYAGTETSLAGNRGVYNSAESVFNATDGVAKTVWDWGTSQANGTIGAVARTQVYAGNGYFGPTRSTVRFGITKPYDLTDTENNNYVPIGFDKANSKLYLYTNGYYYKMDWVESLTINGGILNSANIPRSSSLLTQICATAVTDRFADRWLDVANGKIYTYKVNTYGPSNDGVVTFYVTDLATSTETSTQITLTGAYIYSNGVYSNAFSDGYFYTVGYDPNDTSKYGVYQVSLSDYSVNFFSTTDVVSNAGYTPSGVYGWLYRWGTGGVRVTGDVYDGGTRMDREIFFEQDGTAIFDEPYMTEGGGATFYRPQALGAGVDDVLLNFHVNPNYIKWLSYLYLANDYLGTYCNLPSSVTKTSSETLKLTYTLSDS